ncbi:Zinc finger MYM-type protein 1 [Eumeta japonica]|uniref:Zinc finger MYM-type protein 1 n=1 Tax=Eumeta variegata TaxID=151549 RepID=A0A4C1VG95_EUMVA|nr:Zinc finger MYM-type protein 1 [Eumeta japonica]
MCRVQIEMEILNNFAKRTKAVPHLPPVDVSVDLVACTEWHWVCMSAFLVLDVGAASGCLLWYDALSTITTKLGVFFHLKPKFFIIRLRLAADPWKCRSSCNFVRNIPMNSVFSGLSSDIQNDLIKFIAQVIRDKIKSEISFAKFVSVIADETPDISHREQMSVIFRYLTKTGIEERFVGFFDVTLECGADQLSQSILEVIDQFNCKEKLVGQSYDGAAVMSGAQGGVQTKLNYNVQWLSLFLAILTYLT